MRLGVSFALAGVLVLAFTVRGGAADGDILFPRKVQKAGDTPPARFPHWAHRIRFKCYVCHDAIFQMKAGANRISMDAISEGKFCGTCHDGKTAFAPSFETCGRCHPE